MVIDGKLAVGAAAVAACFSSAPVYANPTGASVVSGQVSIQHSGNLLQVTNSPGSIINWQSFSIGAGEITRFLQQSASSSVLNRVTGAAGTIDPSVILGALQSNGRVFLVNPNGIVFGAGSQIDVAGLVATSLNLSNSDFLAGRLRFTEVPGAGAVVNQGSIQGAPGGQVYLVGPAVTNSGVIVAPQGEVVLAAGNSVELVNPGTPNLRVEVSAADNEARNLGRIVADAGRVGIYAGLINHSGTIRADSAVAAGGRIVLKATRRAVLEQESVTSASGVNGGEVLVLAGDTARIAGRLDASAPHGGDGGFIETSAPHVSIDPGVAVTTAAAHGRTGTWLIDPPDFRIAASGGDMTGSALGLALNSNNMVIMSSAGATAGNGDIFVNDGVSWSSGNSLTLDAVRNVEINSPITNSGSGDVNVVARSGSIVSTAAITTGGYAVLRATQGAIVDGNGAGMNVVARNLEAAAAHGIELDTNVSGDFPSYVNALNSTSGNIVLRNAGGGATIQNIHNAGGSAPVLSGFLSDADSTVVTGGIVIFGDWVNSGGQSTTSPANPRYTFTTTGGTVRIVLSAPRSGHYGIDPYVYLLDSSGNTIALDDDSAQGYTSAINPMNPLSQYSGCCGFPGNVVTLSAGTYTVVAATYSSGYTSPFDLSIGGAVSLLPFQAAVPAVDFAMQQIVSATNELSQLNSPADKKEEADSGTQGAGANKKTSPICKG